MQIKIVLRDRETRVYYRGPMEWVMNPYDALTFRNILEAEEFCRSHSLDHLQLIQQSGYFPRPLCYMPKIKPQIIDAANSASARPSSN